VAAETQKVAIVTGSSRGIGAAIARELAAQGAMVAVNYTSKRDAADATVAEIAKAGGKAFAVQAAVHKSEDLDKLFAAVLERCGRLDILVNNAGVSGTATLDQITPAAMDETLGINLKAGILAAQRAAKAFGDKGGVIINISSSLAVQPMAGQAVYAASKAGIEAATRVLAQELGARKIRVNAVAPGATETDLLPLNDDMRGFIAGRTALGRVGQPGDIAKVVAFLASDAAAWITGHVLGADGGIRV
jgi:3-oxoacyl-[acyl-carrier protein] reductase